MRYAYIQRKAYEPLGTIGEYIQLTDTEAYAKLVSFIGRSKMRDITELIIAAADIFGASKHFQRVMTERPRPGRGGLLPGENEKALTFLRQVYHVPGRSEQEDEAEKGNI